MMRAFLTSTSTNKHVLLALGSDRTGRDDVEINQVGVYSCEAPLYSVPLCARTPWVVQIIA